MTSQSSSEPFTELDGFEKDNIGLIKSTTFTVLDNVVVLPLESVAEYKTEKLLTVSVLKFSGAWIDTAKISLSEDIALAPHSWYESPSGIWYGFGGVIVTTGGLPTTTVIYFDEALSLLSLATQYNSYVPSMAVLGNVGVWTKVGESSWLSERNALGKEYESPTFKYTVSVSGTKVITGGVVSLTLTIRCFWVWLPALSVAV